jgi:signal transduction histidine kinase
MLVLTSAIRLLAFTFGSFLYFLIAGLLAARPQRKATENLIMAAALAAGLWNLTAISGIVQWAILGDAIGPVPRTLEGWTGALGGLVVALLVHLAIVWAGAPAWLGIVGYLGAGAAFWTFQAGSEIPSGMLIAAGLAALALAAAIAGARVKEHVLRAFFRVFALSVALPAAAYALAGPDSVAAAVAALAPGLAVTAFILRYHFLGLLISRRMLFALTLGAFTVVYLFAVRAAANYAELEFDVFGGVLEILLILAAALLWLPVYGSLARLQSRRQRLYATRARRLVEEAVSVLDLSHRLQFLAEGAGRAFSFRRVLLVLAGEPHVGGEFGASREGVPAEALERLVEITRAGRLDMAVRERTRDAELRDLLARCGFTYAFPLWYEGNLTGMLLVDTAPKAFLDDLEDLVAELAREFSHSIAACRVVEQKIVLEKTLLKKEHLATLGTLAATIAHEVKNPLSSIKTLVQLMREDPDIDERYQRDLHFILEEVDRLNGCVQQLLTFSRPAPEAKGDVPIAELLEDTARTLERTYANQKVAIERRFDPQLRLSGADHQSLQQIVLNLLLNAMQASPPGSRVRLEAAVGNGSIFITVEDQGTGIPAEHRERVFEPFFTTKQKGTGLGLAIVQKNVRSLNGDIRLESPIVDGRGTRVTVRLPARIAR